VFILHGNSSPQDEAKLEKAKQLLFDLQGQLPLKEAAAIVSKHTGIRRNQLYSLGLEEKDLNESDNNNS